MPLVQVSDSAKRAIDQLTAERQEEVGNGRRVTQGEIIEALIAEHKTAAKWPADENGVPR